MKRGLLRAYLDLNKGQSALQKDGEKKRKPSRIEERIRLRRQLRLNNNGKGVIKPPSAIGGGEDDADNSTSGTSCSSRSSDNAITKYRDSKQRVDLLELDSNRRPLITNRSNKSKAKSKILFKEKINSILMNNARPRFKARAKSAPCTPLFQIKCAKNNFVDYKIVENDCIEDSAKHEVLVDDLPIGNQLLISVMKESLDKLQAGFKSSKSQEAIADEGIVSLSCQKAENIRRNDIKEEEKPEVVSTPSASGSLEEIRSEKPVRESYETILQSESRDDAKDCGKPKVLKCRRYRWDTSMDRRRDQSLRGTDNSCKPNTGDNCCLHRPKTPDSNACKEQGTDQGHQQCCIFCRDATLKKSTAAVKFCRRISSSRNCCRGLRSRSGPRRVTFCLPTLIPEELNCSDAEVDNDIHSAGGELPEDQSPRKLCRCNYHAQRRHESTRNPRADFFREIITKRQDQSNDFDPGPRTSDDKDWTAGTDEELNTLDGVSFPRETRRAMNVLMQSRDNAITNRPIHRGQQYQGRNQPLREAKVLNKPDLGIFETAGEKAMHVATYAQALAVFQRTCDPPAPTRCQNERDVLCKGRTRHGVQNRSDDSKRIDYPRSCVISNSESDKEDNRTLNGQEIIITMQTNGENGSSEHGVDRTGWTVGLINGRFKYLTAETFGFKINANGASLKKKQLWTLEGSEHQVFLRSHLDRYLAVDQFGNVTCEAEDTADPGCAFQIQVAADGSGRWALKNIQRGYFLGSSQDELKCTAKVPGDAEYWLVHLAARPQVNLRSAGRKRFAHLSAAQDEIHVDAPVPWGEDTLFTLEFRPAAMPDAVEGNGDVRREVRSEAGIGGHYALHTCNNKYLARDGKLLDSCTRDCLYAAEFHAGMLALRDVSGAYLAPIGSKAVLKSRSNTVTRDELFSLEDSLPQASFVAALNQRYVSVKQGVDVTANQDEISGHETFQLEFDRATKRWYLRTMQDRYWTLEAGGGIQASDHKRSSNALFDLVWQPADGTVALRANNGKFLATKRSGHLYANADSPGDSEASKFYFYLMNRPVLVLRCEQGFVGLKSNASPKLECNKASYETIRVERCDRGIVRFKGQNGKYWHADSEGVTSDADVPSDGFYLELREPSRICIKSTDGRYLSAGKNGVFRLGDTDYESATKWEF